jgi:predicted RNA binding protein YcfA (HicA-like mRNA interferase family)
MKLPRDVSGQRLAKAFRKLGYEFTRQRGSHMRYTTEQNGQHHIAIPDNDSLRIGTLSEIMKDVAAHHSMTVPELVAKLEL